MCSTRHRLLLRAALVTSLAMVAQYGCVSTGRSGSPPPTAARFDSAVAHQHQGQRPVVVIAPFSDPARTPVRMRGVGSGMSDAFSRALFNDGAVEVLLRPQLSDTAQRLIVGSTGSIAPDHQAVRDENPQAEFLITGQVTDFHHSADLPADLAKRGLTGKRNDALVAVDYRVLDLRTGRIIATDHVQGVAKAGDSPSRLLYQNVAFGSYIFWETPLGNASEDAIQRMVVHLRQMLPIEKGRVMIVQRTAARRVQLSAGESAGLKVGQELYVCREDPKTREMGAIYDPATLQPLQVRVASVVDRSAEAWLFGQPPAEVPLAGAILMPELPRTSISTVSAIDPTDSESP